MTDEDEWTREDSERVAEDIAPIVLLTRRLDRDDLVRARRELERYDTVGAMLDPTGYRENMEANDRTKERLDALIEFYDALGPNEGEVEEALSGLVADE